MDLPPLNSNRFNPEILYVYHCISENHRGENHYHDFLEMSIILDGTVTYFVDGKTFQCKKGDVFIFNPGIKHYEWTHENEKNTQLHIGFRNLLIEDYPRNTTPFSPSPLSVVKYQEEFLATSQLMIEEKEEKLSGYEIILKTLFMKLMILIWREFSTQPKKHELDSLSFKSNEKTEVVNTLIAYMEDNYMHDISLTKLSENMYLSPVYISKIFKEETGDSPINYLINIRLSQARKLLQTGQTSVKLAAKEVGYEDAYYFSKLFKKHYGYSPSKTKPQI